MQSRIEANPMPQTQDTETARFMQALDTIAPRWWIAHATQVDLRDFAEGAYNGDNRRANQVRERIRATVANRLLVAVRAAVEAGIVTYNEGPTL